MKRIMIVGIVAVTSILGPAAWAAPPADSHVSQGECEEGGGKAGRNADGKLECIGGKYDGAPIIGY
jgi:hypothetical protein